jgi:hypothetical protein
MTERRNPIAVIHDPHDPDPDALGAPPTEVEYLRPTGPLPSDHPSANQEFLRELEAAETQTAAPGPEPMDPTLQVLFAIHTDLETLLARSTPNTPDFAPILSHVLTTLERLTEEVTRSRTYEGQIKLFGQFIKIRLQEVPDAPR